jgi:hypothetical protein
MEIQKKNEPITTDSNVSQQVNEYTSSDDTQENIEEICDGVTEQVRVNVNVTGRKKKRDKKKKKRRGKKKSIVNGILLVLSCQKHKDTRLKEFRLKNNEYDGWKVIYVIGDLFLNVNYKLDDNIMTIKCEDSYIHLLKKFVLAIKYVNEIYSIKQGILRCADDLVFNEKNLLNFLNSDKSGFDLLGTASVVSSRSSLNDSSIRILVSPPLDYLKITKNDSFMVEYYSTHPEDFLNPQHNLKGVNVLNYIKRPEIILFPCGTLYYISNKCCNILVDAMEKINYNIFHFDEFTQSYPYVIEDCGVSFILYLNGIGFLHDNNFVSSYGDFENYDNVLAVSTNKYK